MKKLICTACTWVLLCMATETKAQTGAKSMYFELGGAGLASINYDMRFQKRNDGLGFKVGVGGFKVDNTGALFIPVGLNYLLGKDDRNFFEIGMGLTVVSITENGNGISDDDQFGTTFGHAFFGYRLQPKEGGFLFRAGMTPVFNKNGFIPYWGGISFGYKF